MAQYTDVPTRRLRRALIGWAIVLSLISVIHTETGYINYNRVTRFGWPFPVFSNSYPIDTDDITIVTDLSLIGISFNFAYWYGMVYVFTLIVKTWFPEMASFFVVKKEAEPYPRYDWTQVRPALIDSKGDFTDDFLGYTNGKKEYLGEQYMWRGLTHLVYGFFEAAARDFDRVLKLKTPDAESYYRRGYAYYWIGDYRRAIKDYDQALEIDESNARYWYLRGKALLSLGEIGKAEQDLVRALELDPSHEPSRSILEEIGNEP
jgi:tetratricopeptide (TPR) repeat protein